MKNITPLKHIRVNLFGMTQADFASLAGSSQPTVCRWEREEDEPSRAQMARIREAAIARRIEWDDGLFFSVSSQSEAAQ